MKKKVLVVGEYGIDRFVYGKIERINPEAPTPVLVPVSTKENLGMAGNNISSSVLSNNCYCRQINKRGKESFCDITVY